jgi:predicted MFS family arabinose efflux permease
MVVGRVIQGLGGAVYPIAFGIIRDEFQAHRVPSAVGAMSSVIAVGGGIGAVLAGPINSALGWRWLFWIPLIVVVLVGVLARIFVPRSPVRSKGQINWLASTLLAAWLIALLLPVSQGQRWGWMSPATIMLFVAAVITFGVWIIVESRLDDPVIDMRMMRKTAVLTTNLVAMLFGAAMFSVLAFLPRFIETPESAGYGFGLSVTLAGLIILPMQAAMAVGGIISGPIHRTVSFKAQLTWGSGLLAAGSLGFALWNETPWQIVIAASVFGLGLGLAYAAMTSVIVHAVTPEQTGVATGMNTNIRNIGGAIGTAVVTAAITGPAGPGDLPTAANYATGFTLLAVIATCGVIVSFFIPSERKAY